MPAKLNRVAETSTSTGTGNFTLAGAATSIDPCLRSFASALPLANMHFYYVIKHSTLAEYERGIGYLDAGELVRLLVLESTNGGNVVNFSAGDKLVFSGDSGDQEQFLIPDTSTSHYVRSMNSLHTLTTVTAVNDQLYLVPFINNASIDVQSALISVVNASATAGSVARIGLFEKVSRTVFRLIYDFGTVPVDSTGDKEAVGAFTLPAGLYWAGVVCEGTTGLRMQQPNLGIWLRSDAGNSISFIYTTGVDPTLPLNTYYTFGNTPIVNASAPVVHFKTSTGCLS